jgi:hypothetical protein
MGIRIMTLQLGFASRLACFIPAALALLGCSRDDFGTKVEDDVVTSEIKAKLADAGLTSSFAIEVDADDGLVWLRGTVTSEAARDEAEELARSTVGARRVINELKVGDAPSPEEGSEGEGLLSAPLPLASPFMEDS